MVEENSEAAILRQYGGRRTVRVFGRCENDAGTKAYPAGKMAVALATCCHFDFAAGISFSSVIPVFIDDGSAVHEAL